MPIEFVTSWQISDSAIDHVLDKVMNDLKEKEIAKKRPQYTTISALMDIGQTVNIKALKTD